MIRTMNRRKMKMWELLLNNNSIRKINYKTKSRVLTLKYEIEPYWKEELTNMKQNFIEKRNQQICWHITYQSPALWSG